jgi:hypothetical protein
MSASACSADSLPLSGRLPAPKPLSPS